ncbi:MAG: response regulator transcription factor [Comamonadaceae bacterium]|nr:MAG: response regulator transcription factor [Comamonadaceae bacterium]
MIIPVGPEWSVLVVEDLPEVSRWLAGLVAAVFPDSEVVQVASLAAAHAVLQGPGQFALALVDLGLPDGSGISLIRSHYPLRPEMVIVVTTVHDDDEHLFSAIAAGASGYLLKEQSDAILLHQLRRLHDGELPMSPRMARRMLAYFRGSPAAVLPDTGEGAVPAITSGDPEPLVALSRRETDVLACIGKGLRVHETAQQLGLANSTVAGYIQTLYGKLSICSRAEAALEAARRGLN